MLQLQASGLNTKPLRSTGSSPALRSRSNSSSGVMNFDQSCVPFGSQRMTRFGADDRHEVAPGVAVERRADHQPAGLQQALAGGEVGERVGYVLDHLHVQQDVEALARLHQRLGGGVAVVDVEARLGGVKPRHGDVAGGGVGADHLGAQPRHRLGQEPAAAADVEQAQAGERAGRDRSRPNSAAIWSMM
jgi:hypothetical protein